MVRRPIQHNWQHPKIAAVDTVLTDFPPFERSRLLPMLQAVQARRGSLSKGLLGYLGERIHVPFAEVYGVASFYALLSSDHPAVELRLCSGVPCILAGADQLADVLPPKILLLGVARRRRA